MNVVMGERQSGKTRLLIDWARNGHYLDSYPWWSRVVLAPTNHQADLIRSRLKGLEPTRDVYRWVFTYEEWRNMRGAPVEIEVGIDEMEWALRGIIGPKGVISLVTVNAEGDDSVFAIAPPPIR